MAVSEHTDSGDPKVLKLRLEYLQKRLDHTLQHTQSATKLIYLADGAVLGLCYFWLKAIGVTRGSIGAASIFVFLLAVMNFFHIGLIGNQQSWYNGIDSRLRLLLSEPEVEHPERKFSCLFPRSTHRAYQAIHIAICVALIIAATLMVLYYFGCFQPEVPKGQP